MEALLSIGTAFGLSTSAGLNAYIPLLIVSIMSRLGWLNLSAPYDVIGDWRVMVTLVVMLLIEFFVDKIPAVDTANDLIHTFIRPAAGALLFAANANVITDISPIIAIIAGLLLAGSVHAAKGTVRPVVTASTAGTGNWFVSFIEDILAIAMSLIAILVPFLAVIVAIFLAFLIWRIYRQRQLTTKSVF